MIDRCWVRGTGPTLACVVAVIAGLVALAWANRFIQDDAFISFRYADNLVRGNGLVWNPGERVEGYSNFLWTLLIAGGMRLGLDPVPFSQYLGIALFAVTLIYSFRFGRLFLASDGRALAAVIFLGTNHTFSSYATGGLETQLQTTLIIAGLFYTALAVQRGTVTPAGCAGLGFLCSAAILTRLDAALLFGIMGVFLAYHFRRMVPRWRDRLLLGLSVIGPIVAILGAWLLWKLLYYGTIIPNSFYVKVSGVSGIARGVNYLRVFVLSYWWFVFLPIGAFALERAWRTGSSTFFLIVAVIVSWLGYTVYLGGDFMEFRFLVPILPAAIAVLAWLIFVYLRRPAVQAVLALVLLAGSLHHSMTFVYVPSDGIEPTWQLSQKISGPDEQWAGIGRALGETFGSGSTVSIATTAAGAIPFYSRLRTVDMLGINDPWVARHGASFIEMAGHGKITTLEHLLNCEVNLVLSHPLLLGGNAPMVFVDVPLGDIKGAPPARRVLYIPVDAQHTLVALYLTEHPQIDSLIAARGWRIGRE